MAKIYDNLGRGDDVPVVDRTARPDTSKVAVVDWTVLARVDGEKSIETLLGDIPLSREQVLESLVRLKSLGMVRVESAAQRSGFKRESSQGTIRAPRALSRPEPEPAKAVNKTSVRVPMPTSWSIPFEKFDFDPEELAQAVDLDDEKRRQIIYYHFHLKRVSYYDLFQVEAEVEDKAIRKAYFRLSKEFHPDQFFRKELGTYRRKVEEIFQWVAKANVALMDPKTRSDYDKLLNRGLLGDRPQGRAMPQPSPSMAVREMLAGGGAALPAPNGEVNNNVIRAAQQAEGQGQWDRALVLYKKQLQLGFDATTAHRAARCLLEMEKGLSDAETLCRQAISVTVDTVRRTEMALTLAQVLEQLRRSDEARGIYAEVLKHDPGHEIAKIQLDRLSKTT